MEKSVFDQSCPVHSVNESKVGTLRVTYRAVAGVLTAGQYFSFFKEYCEKKCPHYWKLQDFFIKKIVVNLFGFYKNLIY